MKSFVAIILSCVALASAKRQIYKNPNRSGPDSADTAIPTAQGLADLQWNSLYKKPTGSLIRVKSVTTAGTMRPGLNSWSTTFSFVCGNGATASATCNVNNFECNAASALTSSGALAGDRITSGGRPTIVNGIDNQTTFRCSFTGVAGAGQGTFATELRVTATYQYEVDGVMKTHGKYIEVWKDNGSFYGRRTPWNEITPNTNTWAGF